MTTSQTVPADDRGPADLASSSVFPRVCRTWGNVVQYLEVTSLIWRVGTQDAGAKLREHLSGADITRRAALGGRDRDRHRSSIRISNRKYTAVK